MVQEGLPNFRVQFSPDFKTSGPPVVRINTFKKAVPVSFIVEKLPRLEFDAPEKALNLYSAA